MKKYIIAAAAVVSLSANAAFVTGNKLHEWLKGTPQEKLTGIMYVTGVHDALDGKDFCTPGSVTNGQIADMTLGFLEANPSLRHFTAHHFVVAALKDTFPCAKKGTNL